MSTPDLSYAPPAPARSKVFFGPFGLRAGWSALIFVPLFIVFAIFFILVALAAAGKLPTILHDMASHAAKPTTIPDIRALDAFMADILQFAGLALAAFLLSRIERRHISVYGIGHNRLADFLPGAFWGLATLSLLVALLHGTHLLVFDTRALYGAAAFSSGIKWLLAFLAVGLFEEYFSRGFLQFTLTRGVYGLAEKISLPHARAIAFTIAAFFMSLLFSAGHLHNARENPMGIVMTFLLGLGPKLPLRRSRQRPDLRRPPLPHPPHWQSPPLRWHRRPRRQRLRHPHHAPRRPPPPLHHQTRPPTSPRTRRRPRLK